MTSVLPARPLVNNIGLGKFALREQVHLEIRYPLNSCPMTSTL